MLKILRDAATMGKPDVELARRRGAVKPMGRRSRGPFE